IWQWRSGARRSWPAIRCCSLQRRPWWRSSPSQDRLTYFGKPKLLIVDELCYLPFDQMRRTSSFTAFGDPTCADAILDRLLHGKGLRR
ncbi:MAG TPA: hypothetical protein VE687_15865, partial [Stellaceae bacterium]|nr:hypothetical protein [Stellaceae bacterium]